MLRGQLGGVCYSARGQEFAAASVATRLERRDYLVSTYSGVHDQIAERAPLREFWGRVPRQSQWFVRARGPARA